MITGVGGDGTAGGVGTESVTTFWLIDGSGDFGTTTGGGGGSLLSGGGGGGGSEEGQALERR